MRARVARGRVVPHIHGVDELRFTGQVDVVGARLGTGPDQWFTAFEVGADRGGQDPGPSGSSRDGGRILHIETDQRGLGERRVARRQPVADLSELGGVPPGQTPAESGRRLLGQVVGGQAAGEAGDADQDQIEVSLGIAGHVATLSEQGELSDSATRAAWTRENQRHV